jgi:hypothetical protein
VDEILLIARWFRANPRELEATVAPERVDAVPAQRVTSARVAHALRPRRAVPRARGP